MCQQNEVSQLWLAFWFSLFENHAPGHWRGLYTVTSSQKPFDHQLVALQILQGHKLGIHSVRHGIWTMLLGSNFDSLLLVDLYSALPGTMAIDQELENLGLNESQRVAANYFKVLLVGVGLVQGLVRMGKTFLASVISLLFLRNINPKTKRPHQVMFTSASNDNVDDAVQTLHRILTPLVPDRELVVVRLHSRMTEQSVILHDYQPAPDNARPPIVDHSDTNDSLDGVMATLLRRNSRETPSGVSKMKRANYGLLPVSLPVKKTFLVYLCIPVVQAIASKVHSVMQEAFGEREAIVVRVHVTSTEYDFIEQHDPPKIPIFVSLDW